MIIIPAIDLRGGRCVRLSQGQASAETVYSENPVKIAKRWYDEGAEMLHVVNLDAALGKDDTDNLKALERILYEAPIPVQFGGGVRTLDDVRRLDELGATRIVIGTTAIENPVLLQHIIDEFGSTIVVGIDARDGLIALRGWEKLSNIQAIEVGSKVLYLQPDQLETLSGSDVVLDPPGPGSNKAFGHCSLAIGVCTFSGGTGKFTQFQATAAVSLPLGGPGGPNFSWTGTYSFSPHD